MTAHPFGSSLASAARRGRVHDTLFPVARQLMRAASHQERGAILLRLPDAVVHGQGVVLREACAKSDFTLGVEYLDIRVSAFSAARDATGELPAEIRVSVERWRRGMAALAGTSKAEVD